MENPDSESTTDNSVAGANADNSDAPARPSAIERQMAAVSRIGYDNHIHLEAADRYFHPKRRRRRRFGLVSFLVVFVFVAGGVAIMYIGIGRPPQNNASAPLQAGGQTAVLPNAPPANASRTIAPKEAADIAIPAAISIPIADVSLRNRPELLEQLVQVYRSQLVANPTDSAALAALNRLQKQSLSELEIIVSTADAATSAKSLEIASRLFPELTDNPRYKSLIARSDQTQREAKPESLAEPQPSTLSPTAVSSASLSPVTNAPVTNTPVKNGSASSDSAVEIAKKSEANVSSQKPQIRVVSVTPGTMIEQRFVPGDEGTAFMVEISYRNFKNSDDQSEGALVALLGTPGDPTVLGEVPVDISGDRGTKSFLMETLIPGNTGEKYRLNFTLNGKFLASSTVRLSVPKQ